MAEAPWRGFTAISNVTLSIITATLNSEADLPRLLGSLRRQTDRDFDCLVIDGGSIDGTWAIVESHRDIVTFALREPDNGLYDALNKGIRALRTAYYVVLGADDILASDAVANYKRAVDETGADIVVAGVTAGNKVRRGFHRNRAWLGHAAMVTAHSVGMLFRKTLHDRFGFYSPRFPLLADGFFIKTVCGSESVKIVSAGFVAGEFGLKGSSNRNFVRTLCESWQIQLETGENATIQYLLFQIRLLRYLRRVVKNR